ncbi:ATP-binding protein [Streptomyces sp. NPDC093510]|uniref:ATP-binding protein n=1 Tax=Streptomyces sp. NPDC093510 TaxID=3155199 RepID=UPI0034414DC9
MPLPHTPAAASIARVLVRTALAESPCTEPDAHHDRPHPSPTERDTAELLTAELVTNAVEHTARHAPLELVLEVLPTSCRVEVRDHDPTPVAGLTRSGSLEEPDPLSERGRGLSLVRRLSSSAGCRTTKLGKTVWFTLPLTNRSRARLTPARPREEALE